MLAQYNLQNRKINDTKKSQLHDKIGDRTIIFLLLMERLHLLQKLFHRNLLL